MHLQYIAPATIDAIVSQDSTAYRFAVARAVASVLPVPAAPVESAAVYFKDIHFEMAEKIIDKLPGVESISGQLKTSAVNEAEKDWTFDDYHKHGKLENLKKSNPGRYSELFEAKFGHKPNL